MSDITTYLPLNYTTPHFPSLSVEKAYALYYTSDIILYTTLWTLLLTVPFYTVAGIVAWICVWKRRRWKWGAANVIALTAWGMGVAASRGALTGNDINHRISKRN